MNEQQSKSSRGKADHLAPYQWKPGQSGNPGGAKKGRTLTSRLNEILDKEVDGKTVAQALMEAGVKAALRGDYRYWLHILERYDGKVPDNIISSGTQRIIIERREAAQLEDLTKDNE